MYCLQADPQPKTGKHGSWPLPIHPSDKFANSDAAFTPVVATLAAGTFNNLGMPEAYKQPTLFIFDGDYNLIHRIMVMLLGDCISDGYTGGAGHYK
jgi:hypothetical protein